MKPLLIVTAVASVNMAVGIAIGYKIAEKRLADQFDERLQKETVHMREFYQVVKKPYATPQEAAADLIRETVVEDDSQESVAQQVNSRVAYNKIVKSNYEPTDDSEGELSIDPEISPPGGPEEHNLFVEAPVIITQEEFLQNDSGYIQSTVTYYKLDNVLADERDSQIEDLDETVGARNMLNFGKNSSDPNIVHIRNGRLQMEFEVCLSESSFSREVLGIDESMPELPSGRKRS